MTAIQIATKFGMYTLSTLVLGFLGWLGLAGTISAIGSTLPFDDETRPNSGVNAVDESTRAQKPTVQRRLRHIVLFQFKSSSSPEDIQNVVSVFRQLPKKIPQIAEFEFGTNNSPEGLADGFTHCFLVTFRTEKDRDIYLPHEAHQSFVEVLKPHLEKVLVVDYWAD